MVWSVFDVVCGSGMVHLSILGGNQPRFGEPTDPESTLPSLVGSVTLAATFGHISCMEFQKTRNTE